MSLPNPNIGPNLLPDSEYHKQVYNSIDCTKAEGLKGALPGFKVFITGASQGCGQAMAVAFAQAGASDLYLTARKAENLKETEALVAEAAPKAKVHCYALDVQSEKQVDEVVPQILQAAGKLDCVINNAGRLEQWKPFAETDPADWWSTWEVNIRGLYLVSRLCLQHFIKHGGGTIIEVSSTGALRARAGASAYQTTKLAVNRIVDFIHTDHKDQGVRVFALHPGAVNTSLGRCMPKASQSILTESPLLSAGTCVYLCLPRADFLRGRYVAANWDIPTMEARKEDILAKDLFKMKLAVE